MNNKLTSLLDVSIGKGEYGIGAPAVNKSNVLPTYLRITDINDDGTINFSGLKSVDADGYKKYLLEYGDVVFARTGNSTGRSYVYRPKDGNFVYAGFLIKFKLNISKVIPEYFRYTLLSSQYKNWIKGNVTGSTRSNINVEGFGKFTFKLPEISEQKRIADILTALDDKIELNNQMNQTLEEIASLLYKRWFVDFEFPDDKGNPYKSSGGEMVDSELGMIPKGWEVKELGSFFDVITGKKNANVSEKNGRYRFFTCSRNFTYSDQFEFDTGAIILAGNGDFNVKWYRGKFDAYQRTYVLSPHNQILLDVLFWIIRERLFEITVASKGSVIKFITKGMIENFKIIFPKKSYSKFVIIFSCLNKINEQNTQNNELVENLKLEILKELC